MSTTKSKPRGETIQDPLSSVKTRGSVTGRNVTGNTSIHLGAKETASARPKKPSASTTAFPTQIAQKQVARPFSKVKDFMSGQNRAPSAPPKKGQSGTFTVGATTMSLTDGGGLGGQVVVKGGLPKSRLDSRLNPERLSSGTELESTVMRDMVEAGSMGFLRHAPGTESTGPTMKQATSNVPDTTIPVPVPKERQKNRGMTNVRPDILMVFDYQPAYDRNLSPTPVAELLDLQLQSRLQKHENAMNFLGKALSPANAKWLEELSSLKFQTAMDVVFYFRSLYGSIEMIESALDLKSYNLTPIFTGPGGFGSMINLSDSIQDITMMLPERTKLWAKSTQLSEYFTDELLFSPSSFFTSSNTRIYLQLLTDLKSTILYGSTQFVTSEEELFISRKRDNPFYINDDIKDAYGELYAALKLFSKMGTDPKNIGFSNDPSLFRYSDYLSFISKMPRNYTKRVGFILHALSRDATLSIMAGRVGSLGLFSSLTGGGTGSSLVSPDALLGSAIGDTVGEILTPTLTGGGAAAKAFIPPTSLSQQVPVLAFETSIKLSAPADYLDGLQFFTTHLLTTTMGPGLAVVESPLAIYSEDFYLKMRHLNTGAMTLLLGNHGGDFYNAVIFEDILASLENYLSATTPWLSLSIGSNEAACLAILMHADDPEIGFRLMKFLSAFWKYYNSGSSYSLDSPFSMTSSGPTDAMGDIPDELTDTHSSNYQFYLDDIQTFASALGSENEVLFESLIDLAQVMHNKVTANASIVEAPYTDDIEEPLGEATSFFINTYETITEESETGTQTNTTVIDEAARLSALTTGWGLALIDALDMNVNKIFTVIAEAANSYESTMIGKATTEGIAGLTALGSSTLGISSMARMCLIYEVMRGIIDRYMSVSVASTGYAEVTERSGGTADLDPGAETFEDYFSSYYLNRVRIDIYPSEGTRLASAALYLLDSQGLDSEAYGYAEEVRRELRAIYADITAEDMQVINMCYILYTASERVSVANKELIEVLKSGLAGTSGAVVNPADSDRVAAVITSLVEDVEFSVVDLCPEQICLMWRNIFALGLTDNLYPYLPGVKVVSPQTCERLQTILKTENFHEDPAAMGKRLFSVGIPGCMINQLRDDAISKARNYEEVWGYKNSSIIKIKVYKRDLQRDFTRFLPMEFVFDTTLWVDPDARSAGDRHFRLEERGGKGERPDPGAGSAGTGSPLDLLDNSTALKGLNMPDFVVDTYLDQLEARARSVTLNKMATADMIEMVKQDIMFYKFFHQPNAKVTPGDFMTIMNSWNIIYTSPLLSLTDRRDMLINHAIDAYLKIYVKLLVGLDLDESGFQYKDVGFGSTPDPDTLNAFKTVIQKMKSLLPANPTADDVLTFRSLSAEILRSSYFNSENYADRCVNPGLFDRVFSFLVDPDGFVEIHRGASKSAKHVGEAVKKQNKEYPKGKGRPKTLPKSGPEPFTGDSEIGSYFYDRVDKAFKNSVSRARYYDFFVTVELIPIVQTKVINPPVEGTGNAPVGTVFNR